MSTPRKTEGLVIRQADFSESSRVVTFFTRDYGKVAVLAKGAKRLRSSFEAAIDLLTRCQIVFLHKSSESLDILTEAKLVSRFRAATGDVNAHYAGLYVAELLEACSEPDDPAADWYQAAVLTLNRLEHEDDFRQHLLRFELRTLETIGLLPEFESCRCGAPVLADRARWSVWIQQGELLCTDCRQPEFSSKPLTGEVLTDLRRVVETEFDDPLPFVIPAERYRLIRPLMTALISHVLGKRPKLLTYLKF